MRWRFPSIDFCAAPTCCCSPVSFALSMLPAFCASCCLVTSSSSCVNWRCVFFHSLSKSSHTIQIVDRNRKMLDAAKTTFRKSML